MYNYSELCDDIGETYGFSVNQTTKMLRLVQFNQHRTLTFSGNQYLYNDTSPGTLEMALRPFIKIGYPIELEAMHLEVAYNPLSSSFAYRAEPTCDGAINFILNHTDLHQLDVNLVYKGDELEIDNAKQEVKHTRCYKSSEIDGVYCVINGKNGITDFTSMSSVEAHAALDANIEKRLHGVNPYTGVHDLEVFRRACLYRALKAISVNTQIDNIELIQHLIHLHAEQYKPVSTSNVTVIKQDKFRGFSHQSSVIDTMFNSAKGAIVVPFNHSTKKSKKIENKANEQEFGFGF